MNSSPSPHGTQAPRSSRPENEDDDPVGDNQPVTASTPVEQGDESQQADRDDQDDQVDQDDQDDRDDRADESNAGAVRTGNDGQPPQSDPVPEDVPKELPEGSDAPPSDRLNDHRQDKAASSRSGRPPSSDSKLPQSSRG
nr:hypothetical protein [uncultured Roseateles sp.]